MKSKDFFFWLFPKSLSLFVKKRQKRLRDFGDGGSYSAAVREKNDKNNITIKKHMIWKEVVYESPIVKIIGNLVQLLICLSEQ